MNKYIVILIALLILTVFVCLSIIQIYLSTRKSRWLGFFIPLVFFLMSIILVIKVPNPATANVVEASIYSYGNERANTPIPLVYPNMDLLDYFRRILLLFLYTNIPTFLLILLYFLIRKEDKKI